MGAVSRRVRFAPSPTGSLHLGNALTAVANRSFGDWLLLRIDDTDPARAVPGGEAAIVADLQWLGVRWDEGPVRQSERLDRHREAALEVGREDEEGAVRFGRATLLRPDGTATYHLASVVDDVDFGITHVVRGKDLQPSTALHVELARALGAEPPEYVHHGLILGEDGHKLSKRHGLSALAELREAGIPPEAVHAYLEELDLPRGDVHRDLARIRRLSTEALAALSDEELAARVGVPAGLAPLMRGAHDLVEARSIAESVLAPVPAELPAGARPTLEHFRELADLEPRALLRELKAAGGDLRALRLALTGHDRGPELWAILAALPREEALRRVDAAL